MAPLAADVAFVGVRRAGLLRAVVDEMAALVADVAHVPRRYLAKRVAHVYSKFHHKYYYCLIFVRF